MDQHTQRIERVLEILDRSPARLNEALPGEALLDADDRLLARELASTAVAMSAAGAEMGGAARDAAGTHYTLEEIGRLAAARRAARQSGDWQMPAHLSRCPLCLEAYALVVEGLPPLVPVAKKRFLDLWRTADCRRVDHHLANHRLVDHRRARRSVGRRFAPWAIAATVLIAAGLVALNAKRPVHVSRGTVALRSGEAVADRDTLPPDRELIAQTDTEAVFSDGSRIVAARDARFTIRPRSVAGTSVYLHGGQVDFKVAHQPRFRQFRVETDLGEITVVGTQFRVVTATHDVMVFRNQSGSSSTPSTEKQTVVTVAVDEGQVRVNNRHEEVLIGRGERATIRQGQPKIDVDRGAK